jgi:hypothetical protein
LVVSLAACTSGLVAAPVSIENEVVARSGRELPSLPSAPGQLY